MALTFWAWGPDYFLARLYMVGMFALLFALVHVVTAALHSRAAGVVASLFLLCVPYVWYYGLHVLGEVPAAVFFLSAVCLLARVELARSEPRATASATREDQLVDGLYEQEPGFRWMAAQARLFLGVSGPKGRIHLAFHLDAELRAHESHPVALAVTVNDRLVSRFRLTTAGEGTGVTDCVVAEGPGGLLRVELATDRSFIPMEIGLNDDTRDLALQIRRVEFRPDDRC